jgi:hypothetical protein
MPKGAYNIDVTASGYLPGEFGRERPQSPIPRALDVSRQLDLADGEVKTDVSIHLWRLGAITGTVVDEYGQPVVGVDVRVMAVNEIWIGRISAYASNTSTDDRGIYRVEVSPGDYIVGVGTSITTMPAQMVDDYRQKVTDMASSQAMFMQFNANGLPTPPQLGVRVGDLVVGTSENFLSRGNPWFWTNGENGPTFVYPATYYPSANLSTMASTVKVEAGQERSGIDLQLRPQPAFTVSGHLVGPSGMVGGVGLRLIGADFNTKTSSPSPYSTVAATDESGAFTFIGVTAGQYTLDAVKVPASATRVGTTIAVSNGNGGSAMSIMAAPNANSSEPVFWASQPVTVGGADVPDVLVTMTEAARISGRFVFPAGAPPLTPDQLRAITVSLRVQPGTVAGRLSPNSVLGTTTDDTGNFRTSELVPGPYLITASRLPAGWFLASAVTGGKDAADVPIEIGPGGINDLVMTFTNKSTTLTGAVTGDEAAPSPPGQTMSPPTVVVFSTNQSFWPKVALSPRTLRSVSVSATLTYRTAGLPPGEYYVAASSSASDFTDPKVLLFLSKSAVRVTLAEGESRAQDVRAVVVPAIR